MQMAFGGVAGEGGVGRGGARAGGWEKGDKRAPALGFHMQSRARVSAAGPLDRKRRRFPRAGRRIMAQKQAH